MLYIRGASDKVNQINSDLYCLKRYQKIFTTKNSQDKYHYTLIYWTSGFSDTLKVVHVYGWRRRRKPRELDLEDGKFVRKNNSRNSENIQNVLKKLENLENSTNAGLVGKYLFAQYKLSNKQRPAYLNKIDLLAQVKFRLVDIHS